MGRIVRAAMAAATVALIAAGSASAADSERTRGVLAFQYELGHSVPLVNAPWIGTHNSFNSIAEMGPTLSDLDSNQQISIVDQLDEGMRSLELDLHWFPSADHGLARAPVVCHALPDPHVGCTVEKPLDVVLAEIDGWLARPENSEQVLLLYLEDHLDEQRGYDSAAGMVVAGLGPRLFAPAGDGACHELPVERLTRKRVIAKGKQVVIVSDCGIGSAWPGVAFSWENHAEERPMGYADYPDCGPDFSRSDYDTKLIRYYEDSTRLTQFAGTPDDGIDGPTGGAMTRCGVDLIGFDQLMHDDPRLASLVWTWAEGDQLRRRCAVQRAGAKPSRARWHTRRCSAKRVAACIAADGSWLVTDKPKRRAAAGRECRKAGAELAVPRTGFEAQLLREAMVAAGEREAWLRLRKPAGGWL